VIFLREGHGLGLTTDFTIWIVTALGMAFGGGYYFIAGFWIGTLHEIRTPL
jgi:uncharacterized membrane protein YhiD involved in acid resistance